MRDGLPHDIGGYVMLTDLDYTILGCWRNADGEPANVFYDGEEVIQRTGLPSTSVHPRLRMLMRLRYLEPLKHESLVVYPLEYRPTRKGELVIRSLEPDG
jgi:hypothetical protein